MWNRRTAVLLALAPFLFCAEAQSGDEEGCLICHRLELRKSSAEGGRELKVSDLRGGPHEALHCSDCHAEAKTAPHPASPGPAGCIGECHSSSVKAQDSHRAASFGGLTESHRRGSAPRAPCILCHREDDRPGDTESIVLRCGGCHPEELHSAARGVHARIGAAKGKGACTVCHVAHPAPGNEEHSAGGGAACIGKECHSAVSPGMKRLGGHGRGAGDVESHGRGARAAAFLAIVALGVLSGRGIGRKKGKGGRSGVDQPS